MKKMICMLLMAIVCLQLADAQNPGYLGKHFFVNVDGVISPSRNNPTWVSEKMVAKGTDMYDKNTGFICRYLGFNYLVSPSVEYVAWKKGSIGVGYNFFQSAFSRPVSLEFFDDDRWRNVDYYVRSHGFNVYYKQYLGKDATAPFGLYAKFQFDGFFNYYAPYADSIRWQPTSMVDTNSTVRGRNALFGVKAELGYEYLFFDRLRFSVGFSLGTTFGGYAVTKEKFAGGDVFADRHLTVENMCNNRILNAYSFGIKVGLSVLLF